MASYYDRFAPSVIETLKDLNEKLEDEKKSHNPDRNKMAKLYQQIMMYGLEMGAGPMGILNKSYR